MSQIPAETLQRVWSKLNVNPNPSPELQTEPASPLLEEPAASTSLTEMLNSALTAFSFEDIEAELEAFEQEERDRLGIEEEELDHWVDENPQLFTRSQRENTTILNCGLTQSQDLFIQEGLSSLGYKLKSLDVPDNAALNVGKEFGNRGQCNPTYFTVGNLVKYLIHLRDVEGMSSQEIVDKYVFLTAGACGPCRFGTYATEYRKALRDAGFEGFRVMLFQQQGGLKQASGEASGLELNPKFFITLLKAIMAGDVLNAIGYRIRPYEVVPGSTDEAIAKCKDIICEAFRSKSSILRALYRCRKVLSKVEVDRLQAKPKVMIIGEFWAMTTEGDGNYKLQRFLESEGAEVDIQIVTAWLLYNIWQHRYDTEQRHKLRGVDGGRSGLQGKDGVKKLRTLWVAERVLRTTFATFCKAVGLTDYKLPDMDEVANLAKEYYHNELRGGEGHMEVGKLIQTVEKKKAHMVISVKPFGCMPSSGVSDGIQSLITKKYPAAIFCPIETSGDGAVNVQSRVQMFLFKARKKAKEEFDAILEQRGLSLEQAKKRIKRGHKASIHYPKHIEAGTGSNSLLELK